MSLFKKKQSQLKQSTDNKQKVSAKGGSASSGKQCREEDGNSCSMCKVPDNIISQLKDEGNNTKQERR